MAGGMDPSTVQRPSVGRTRRMDDCTPLIAKQTVVMPWHMSLADLHPADEDWRAVAWSWRVDPSGGHGQLTDINHVATRWSKNWIGRRSWPIERELGSTGRPYAAHRLQPIGLLRTTLTKGLKYRAQIDCRYARVTSAGWCPIIALTNDTPLEHSLVDLHFYYFISHAAWCVHNVLTRGNKQYFNRVYSYIWFECIWYLRMTSHYV